MTERRDSRSTPFDDGYPSCERTFAEFTVYSGDIGPDVVTARLGLTPTWVLRKGQSTTNSLSRTRTGKLNAWVLASEGEVSSKDLRRHLDWLLDRLQPVSGAIEELQKEVGVTMAVDCNWWSKVGQGGPTLWPEQMARLAALNLECAFAVSFYAPDDIDSDDDAED